MPKVKRGMLVTLSVPTQAVNKPNRPLIIPLCICLPDRLIITVSPNMTMAKNSHGPNSKAALARGGVANIKATPLRSPPKKDAQEPVARATPGLPCCDMG
jgi:hypothetical protein